MGTIGFVRTPGFAPDAGADLGSLGRESEDPADWGRVDGRESGAELGSFGRRASGAAEGPGGGFVRDRDGLMRRLSRIGFVRRGGSCDSRAPDWRTGEDGEFGSRRPVFGSNTRSPGGARRRGAAARASCQTHAPEGRQGRHEFATASDQRFGAPGGRVHALLGTRSRHRPWARHRRRLSRTMGAWVAAARPRPPGGVVVALSCRRPPRATGRRWPWPTTG